MNSMKNCSMKFKNKKNYFRLSRNKKIEMNNNNYYNKINKTLWLMEIIRLLYLEYKIHKMETEGLINAKKFFTVMAYKVGSVTNNGKKNHIGSLKIFFII